MTLNKTYSFTDIEIYAGVTSMQLIELGVDAVGEGIVTLKDDYGKVITFILISASGIEYFYKCVYTDF